MLWKTKSQNEKRFEWCVEQNAYYLVCSYLMVNIVILYLLRRMRNMSAGTHRTIASVFVKIQSFRIWIKARRVSSEEPEFVHRTLVPIIFSNIKSCLRVTFARIPLNPQHQYMDGKWYEIYLYCYTTFLAFKCNDFDVSFQIIRFECLTLHSLH